MAQVQPTQQIQQAKPVQQANTQTADEPTEEDVQSSQKWYTKWWLWLIITAVILLIGFGIWYFFL